MKELSKQILEIVKSRNGITAFEIAKILGCDKASVNSALYSANELKKYCWQDSSYRWYSNDIKEQISKKSNESKNVDVKLHNICKYYLSCLNAEASSGISAFLNSRFELPYVEIDGIEKDNFQKEEVVDYLNRKVKHQNISTYLGYPILVDKFKSKTGEEYYKIYPVFTYSVEYNAGDIEISEIPSINVDLIRKYSNNNSQEVIYEQLQLEDELGISGESIDVPVDELAMRLKSIRAWDWKEELNPYSIDTSKPLAEFTETGIYNRAVIMACEKSPYTIGLESELSELSQKSTEDIKGTALYDWIYNKANEMVEISNESGLLEVLPLNSEQYQAVETALNQKTTIITGPPGTGKSQVVTDILVNMAYNNKSVLFSSKNNQAVLVVNDRVNGLAKKPIMIKVGGTTSANYLAELVENLLESCEEADENSNYKYYKIKYDNIVKYRIELNNKKKDIYTKRNNLDRLEQKIRTFDEMVQKRYSNVDGSEIVDLKEKYKQYFYSYRNADKTQQSAITKMLWKLKESKRKEELLKQADIINNILKDYNLELTSVVDKKLFHAQKAKFDELIENLMSLNKYKNLQNELKGAERLEEIDAKIFELDNMLSDIAINLWKEWLYVQNNQITISDRKEMNEYIAAVRLFGDVDIDKDPTLKKQFKDLQTKMTKYLPCWAVTSLSVKGRIPFKPAIYDLLIIDEASQCDIASILPLLYRAKRTVIIGDPKQLTHITAVSNGQDLALLRKNNVDLSWSYSQCSLYSLASGLIDSKQIIKLRDHHRSCADIIEFSNEEFYDGKLRIATNYSKLNPPKNYNIGIKWIDVKGECIKPNGGSVYNPKEISEVVNELKKLVESEYEGKIGVVTPFRNQAEKIKEAVESDRELDNLLNSKNDIVIDTVHKFQGDEKDVIIFSPVISKGVNNGAINFLNKTGNLFNVAITRARSTLIVVGDQKACSESSIKYMEDFIEYYKGIQSKKVDKEVKLDYGKTRDYPEVANEVQVSEWEKIFYTALFDAGIKTIPQYPADKYFLDLAIIEKNRRLDIEIDGEMYHRDWNGELCYRDQIRNNRLKELGWDVKRFWVQQIRDECQWCVEEIKKWIENG